MFIFNIHKSASQYWCCVNISIRHIVFNIKKERLTLCQNLNAIKHCVNLNPNVHILTSS